MLSCVNTLVSFLYRDVEMFLFISRLILIYVACSWYFIGDYFLLYLTLC